MTYTLQFTQDELIDILVNHINNNKQMFGNLVVCAEDISWKYAGGYDTTEFVGATVDLAKQLHIK